MGVRIVTDSGTDLDNTESARAGIEVVPVYLKFGAQKLRDGFDVDRGTFNRRIKSGETVETEPPSAADYRAVFQRIADAGDQGVLITLSSSTSKSFEHASEAVKGFEGKIAVVDSRAAGGLQTLLALYAVERAKAGDSAAEIAKKLDPANLKIAGFFAVPNINVLGRSGRVPKAVVALGSMLGVSLVLKMNEHGAIAPAGQSRSFDKTCEIMVDTMVRAIEHSPGAWVAISHVQAPQAAQGLSRSLATKLGHPPLKEFMHETTPTVAANLGEGAVGIFAIVP